MSCTRTLTLVGALLSLSLPGCSKTSAPAPEDGTQDAVEPTPAGEAKGQATVDDDPGVDAALASDLAAACECPSRAESGEPADRAAVLGACLKDSGRSPTFTAWVAALPDKSPDEKRRSLRELMERAGVSECSLEATWAESTP